MPSQKVGTPSASALQPLSQRSTQEPGLSALTTATGTPSSRPTTVAETPSCIVAGIRCTIRSSTGSRFWIDKPKSPTSALRNQLQYCTAIGWSRPRRTMAAWICSGVAFSPTMAPMGEPGTA